jgi:hypothetical protein
MRRALLLAALAAPAVATAQTMTQGVITFTEGTTDLVHGPWISLAECTAAKANASDPAAAVNLSWITRLTNTPPTFPAGATYQVYASTAAITGDACPTTNSTTPEYKAGSVGDRLTALGQTVNLQSVKIANIFTAIQLADCAAVSGDTSIYVCVQAFQSNGTNDVPIGIATGTMKLSITAPSAPTSVTAIPADDGALQIRWAAPAGSPSAYDYRLALSATDPRDMTTHTKTDVRALSYTMTGLVNDVTYTIDVYARSEAGNESTPGTGTGTPVPVADFWDVYSAYGGREQGGCGTGAAGPVALLGVAALLAALRRRA